MPSVSPPCVGQQFLDEEGVHWTLKNIILSDALEGFFLASLTHGTSPEQVDGTMVLAPLELEALLRTRGMKVTHMPPRPCERLTGANVAAANSPTPDAIQ